LGNWHSFSPLAVRSTSMPASEEAATVRKRLQAASLHFRRRYHEYRGAHSSRIVAVRGGSLIMQESSSKSDPTVVGIGASAGGLAALKIFLDHVSADSGLAFVVVVHLSPDHESHLAELLQPHVRFPVQQVTETTLLEPN